MAFDYDILTWSRTMSWNSCHGVTTNSKGQAFKFSMNPHFCRLHLQHKSGGNISSVYQIPTIYLYEILTCFMRYIFIITSCIHIHTHTKASTILAYISILDTITYYDRSFLYDTTSFLWWPWSWFASNLPCSHSHLSLCFHSYKHITYLWSYHVIAM